MKESYGSRNHSFTSWNRQFDNTHPMLTRSGIGDSIAQEIMLDESVGSEAVSVPETGDAGTVVMPGLNAG